MNLSFPSLPPHHHRDTILVASGGAVNRPSSSGHDGRGGLPIDPVLAVVLEPLLRMRQATLAMAEDLGQVRSFHRVSLVAARASVTTSAAAMGPGSTFAFRSRQGQAMTGAVQ